MSDEAVPISLCLLALFLGAMQGRVATLRSDAPRVGILFTLEVEERDRSSLGAYTTLPMVLYTSLNFAYVLAALAQLAADHTLAAVRATALSQAWPQSAVATSLAVLAARAAPKREAEHRFELSPWDEVWSAAYRTPRI